MLSLCCGISEIFFFFFLHNSFPALSLSSLSSTLLPLSAPMPEHYLPQSSLCRFLEQVQLLPASPSPPSTRKGEKASVQLPVRAAAAANCASAQLREDPRLLETRGLREWASLLFFPLVCFVLFFFFLSFLFFREAQVLWRLLLSSRMLSARDTRLLLQKVSLPIPRARAHTRPARGFSGPRGRWGRREHHPPPRLERGVPRVRWSRGQGSTLPWSAGCTVEQGNWKEILRSGLGRRLGAKEEGKSPLIRVASIAAAAV